MTRAQNAQASDGASPASDPRRIPSVDRLLGHASARDLAETYGRSALTGAIRADLARIRSGDVAGGDEEVILARCAEVLAAERRPSLRPVFNL
ncbi:MAG: L-seryl-tRNA(Sec) selenium transferase, partial [Parafilimonas terrae]|nr:L-seryl-tRNA(Sec) selenium transferase [Parafilimonas terrae]